MAGVARGLRIGQVAELAGVSVKTVRHYEQVGVLDEPPRAANGYRIYGPEAVLRVAQVARLRALGVPLKRLRDALGDERGVVGAEIDALLDFLTEERDRLDARIAALRKLTVELGAGGDLLEADGAQALRELRRALGDHAERVPPVVWRLEQRVAGVFAALSDGEGGLPAAVLELARAAPAELVALMEVDGALAELGDAEPDDPRVARVAGQLRRCRDLMQQLAAAAPPPTGRARSAVQAVMAPRVSAAQRRALELAFSQEERSDAVG